jgi:hypothetical protein
MSGISDEEKWECYLCGNEFNLEQPACGWLGNYHMLCRSCADSVYFDAKSKFHQTLTYHYAIGDIETETFRTSKTRP